MLATIEGLTTGSISTPLPVLGGHLLAFQGTSVGSVWGSTFLASWLREAGAVSSARGASLHCTGASYRNSPFLVRVNKISIFNFQKEKIDFHNDSRQNLW